MDEIRELLSALASDGIDMPELEVAEALWLAAHMHGAGTGVPGGSRPDPRADLAVGADVTSALGTGPLGEPGRPREVRGAGVPIWHGESRSAARLGREALPIRLPVQRELRRPLDLQRALRPFGRSMPSRSRVVLDEQATAEFSADAGSLFPLFRAGAERWFRLALVIDASQSMILWSQLAMELRETLEQTGVFGSVRTWYLDGDSPEAVIGSADGSGAPHRPRELVDPSGRQIILVLSDCVGGAWRSGSALRALDLWGRSGPAAIVQPLPQELWDRSPVGCHHVQLGAAPGLPNHRLAVWWDDLLLAEERPAGVPVPVLELEPDWFAAWAGLITGGLRRTHLIAAFTGEQPALADEVAADGFAEPGQRRAVQRFMSSASPEAFRLAGLLAAAPLNLPMMRHIQQAMQPAGRSAHLAEVYLSGLLRVTQASGAEREYEFISGVRELLLDTVRRSEVIKVGELVSAELDRTYGTAGRGYTAFVGAGTREGDGAPGHTGLAYSAIGAQVLRRIGGRYAEAALAPVTETTATARADNDGPAGRKVALLVASADRSRQPYLGELNSLAAMLRDPEVAGFAETRILADIPAGRLDKRIHSFLLEHGGADLVMVYLVGRTVIDADGRLWLASEDDVPREPASRYADLTRVANLLGEGRARRKLVVVDGDYNHSAFETIGGGGIDVLTAPFPEDALVGSPAHSAGLILCRAITQALTGELPGLRAGGIITIDQVCQYAYDHSAAVWDSVSVQWYRSGAGTDVPFARVRRAALAAARTQTAAGTEESPYVLASVISKPELGSFSFLAEGGFGRIFRLDTYRLPQDNVPLAYKEFIRGINVQVRSATLAVRFREQLSTDEREVLDSFSTWPRAVVSDTDGTACGCLLPLLSRDYYAEQADIMTSERKHILLEMQWLIASERQIAAAAADIPAVNRQDRLRLLARLAHAIAWLHHRGWVYGGISFKNIAFSADRSHIMLLDCDNAAPVADLQRQQPLTLSWVPPELEGKRPGGRLQDPASEVYQLGLAILRCLTPGAGAAVATDPARLAGVLNATGIDLVTNALSADRSTRPTAGELARYLGDLAAAGADVQGSQGQRGAALGQIVMPFYVVFDVSYSMIGAINVLNDAIQEMWRDILRNPLVDDTAQICLISFSDEARVVAPMGPASQSRPPVVSVEGGTNYGNAFRLLAQTIVEDVATLKRDGYRVFRPCAFFLTDGEPLDSDYLEVFTRELTYDPQSGRGMRQHPIFVPFGFRDAPEDMIRRLAYPAGRSRWFHSRSTDLAEGLRGVLSVIMNSVTASGASASTGRPIHVIQLPDRYQGYTESSPAEDSTDDEDWI